MIESDITDQQTTLAVDATRLRQAALRILADHGPSAVRLSIAVVDDPAIHALNRQYLQHDYPTDVLSFVLEREAGYLEGEVVVSSETAVTQATRYGLQPLDELLLYVVHGVLHLVGFDDKHAYARQQMRCAERRYLEELGIVLEESKADNDPAF
jgi:probable rRNA maturation factor